MKKILFITALVLSFGTISHAQQEYKNTKIKIGQDAPELAFPNPEGKVLSLKKTGKGSFVLIDFWASWCGPCRRANPQVVELYKQYKDLKFKGAPKGFKIFSVSLDKNKESWVNAIKADKLSWPYHVSDLKAWQSEAGDIYGIRFIPQAFLMSPDGKIIGEYTTGINSDIASQVKRDLDKYLIRKGQ
jgi:thiol-disulfide isomerase/thioredoxin